MKINLKQIHENIDGINFLNKKDNSGVTFSRNIEIVGGKIKGNVKDILDYKREFKKLWEFKRKKSQEVIEFYNYNEKSKFYKWIHPKLISLKNGKYFISSYDESSSRIESHLDGSKKYTNQEVISSTDGINPEYYSYGPLLISFNLKNALQTGGVLCYSDGYNRVFQFPHKIELPIIVENGMEWTIDVYTKYRLLFDALYKDNTNINIENNNFLCYFSIYDNCPDVLKVRYKINENENMINIISQEGDIDDEKFRLAVFGIVISNGLSLKKDNLVIEIDGNKTFLNDYYK